MRRAMMTAVAALLVAGCGSNGGSGAVEVTAGTTPAGLPAATNPAATNPAATNPAATNPAATNPAATTTTPKPVDMSTEPDTEVTAQSNETFTMPNVKGMNLQEAQDELQGRGSYLMDQEDAGKHHRIQVLDRNWKVCTQIPRAGRKVPLSTIVRLAAVKLDERCP